MLKGIRHHDQVGPVSTGEDTEHHSPVGRGKSEAQWDTTLYL